MPPQTDTALTYDAVQLLAKAMMELDSSQVVDREAGIGCDGKHTWRHGNSLINYMKLVRWRQFKKKKKKKSQRPEA